MNEKLKEELTPYAQYKSETGIAVTTFSTRDKIWAYVHWLEAKVLQQQTQTEVSEEEWCFIRLLLTEEIKDMRKDRGLLKHTENELEFLGKLEELRKKFINNPTKNAMLSGRKSQLSEI